MLRVDKRIVEFDNHRIRFFCNRRHCMEDCRAFDTQLRPKGTPENTFAMLIGVGFFGFRCVKLIYLLDGVTETR